MGFRGFFQCREWKEISKRLAIIYNCLMVDKTEGRDRQQPNIVELTHRATWSGNMPPVIPKEVPQSERLLVMRSILGRSVGQLTLSHRITATGKEIGPYTGTGFLVYDGGRYYVVTAQHCVNPNYDVSSSHAIIFTRGERKFQMPNSDLGFELGDATYYPPETEGERVSDVAIMPVLNPPAEQLSGRGLDLISDQEIAGPTDDGIIYFAGFSTGDSLLLGDTREKQKGTFEDTSGTSGGPFFVVINGTIKVLSNISGTDLDTGRYVANSTKKYSVHVRTLISKQS
jgi:hypothetical protein